MTRPNLGKTTAGKPIDIDLERLVGSRMLLQANSGAGKSWAIRRILEQTHGQIQQLVIDPEGEFYTLRESFDFVLAGRGGDCPAEPRSAHLLARRLLELGASAVIDIYELKPHDRIRFVRRFLEALVDAPRKLWHPALVIVDEAHVYAPQKGQAESGPAVADLMSRGRKRGFCGILATQRLSKLHKDAAAEANNYLIGRASLDADMKRAADELGFSGREEQHSIRRLGAGEFYAFGPALCDEVTQIKVGPIVTSHPKAGASARPAAPPRAQVQKVLAQLADLPAEAEQEAVTIDDLRRELRAAQAEVRALQAGRGVPSAQDLEVARAEGEARGRAMASQVVEQWQVRAGAIATALERAGQALDPVLSALSAAADAARKPLDVDLDALPTPEVKHSGQIHRFRVRESIPNASADRRSATPGDPTLGKGERATLIAVAQRPDGVERDTLSVLTGYKRSTRDAYLQRLGAAGLVEVVGRSIVPTDAGVAALGSDYEPLPVGEDLRAYWIERLPEGERRVLEALVDAFPEGVARAEIDAITGYKRSTRDAYIQRLQARRLVEVSGGGVTASGDLF